MALINVGWLDREHSFDTGSPPAGLLPRLVGLVRHNAVNRTRGYHTCAFCTTDHAPHEPPAISIYVDEGRAIPLGDAEIWIESPQGPRYAAPDLVLHYVDSHHYLPPSQFIDAVLASRRWHLIR